MPGGWEFVGRLVVVVGLAGVMGVFGRVGIAWLRRRRPPDAR